MTTLTAFDQKEKTVHNSHKFGFTLNSDNYGYWKLLIQPFLVTNNLFGYVDGTIPCPKPTILVASSSTKDKEPASPPQSQPKPPTFHMDGSGFGNRFCYPLRTVSAYGSQQWYQSHFLNQQIRFAKIRFLYVFDFCKNCFSKNLIGFGPPETTAATPQLVVAAGDAPEANRTTASGDGGRRNKSTTTQPCGGDGIMIRPPKPKNGDGGGVRYRYRQAAVVVAVATAAVVLQTNRHTTNCDGGGAVAFRQLRPSKAAVVVAIATAAVLPRNPPPRHRLW
ncbi:hypothetical protein OSB04_006245 [Centaurea solstitialis]|uniref:Retrotransposon Copia-like N-terminal domain-containing protein n=1 Tax=Centaurea solstitialis TaxID=347529 RepID=A0AA38TU92_9ASTR|nr:hypothetical protein OSB04_006245 [Centaurea solstitialis]